MDILGFSLDGFLFFLMFQWVIKILLTLRIVFLCFAYLLNHFYWFFFLYYTFGHLTLITKMLYRDNLSTPLHIYWVWLWRLEKDLSDWTKINVASYFEKGQQFSLGNCRETKEWVVFERIFWVHVGKKLSGNRHHEFAKSKSCLATDYNMCMIK